MSKLGRILAVSFLVAGVFTGPAGAEEFHKDWWRFLKGEWTYEITPLNLKGTATWRIAAKGNAAVAKFVEENGDTSVELGGWRSDTKTMFAVGYGSLGNYWQLELNKVTADTIEGPNHGIMPDGRRYEGIFTGKRIDDDHYEWHFKGKTGAGEELSMTGNFTRKTK